MLEVMKILGETGNRTSAPIGIPKSSDFANKSKNGGNPPRGGFSLEAVSNAAHRNWFAASLIHDSLYVEEAKAGGDRF